MGRLRSGWNRSDAQLELQTLPPPVSGSNGPRLVQLTGTAPGQRSGVPKTTEVIFDLLFAGCLLVLLLACANVGSIQLARMLTRRPEIATRLALGASRGRVIRQLLTEGLLMTLGAAGFALAAAFILPAAVLGPLEGPNPTLSFAPDLTVFVVCLALSLASWLAVGLGPALHITGQRGLGMDRLRGRSVTAVTGRWRSVLLGTQLAIGMALLIGATLLSRSLQGAISNDLGYAEGIAYSSIQAPQGPYEGAQSLAFVEALRGRMEAEGFRDIAFTRRAPLSRGITTVEARLVGAPPESAKDVRLGNVSASYFSVLESEFAEGRAFADDPRTLDVVVNQALIRAFKLPSPTTGSVIVVNGATRTIVGVVRDQHLDNLEPVRPTLFQPIVAGRIMTVLVRSTDPEAGRRLLSAIHAIDPGLPAIAGSLTDLVEPLTRQNRVGVAIASAISAVALGLAAVGVFGLFGFLVEHRRREIGIRLVLGAKRSELVQLVFAGAKGAMLGGLTAGLLLSFLVGDALKRFLFGMTPVDPISYLVACGILAAAIGLGTFVPARRAVSVDPAETLRSE
jgi:predicted permease